MTKRQIELIEKLIEAKIEQAFYNAGNGKHLWEIHNEIDDINKELNQDE